MLPAIADTDAGPEQTHPAALPFRRVAIVGVGLIGGSLALALRARGLAEHIVGVDRSEQVIARARAIGAIDEGSLGLDSLATADCVMFATPVGSTPDIMAAAATFVDGQAIVTDVGSVKCRVVAAGERLFGANFVGGHPMAGSEAGGIDAARPDLFDGAAWALVSTRAPRFEAGTASARLEAMVTALGGRPIPLDPGTHDHLVGLNSHLPHAASFAFARTLEADPCADAAVGMAGASYRDLVRVSRSSPNLWADILLENRDFLIPILTAYEHRIQLLADAIGERDRDALLRYLQSSSAEPV